MCASPLYYGDERHGGAVFRLAEYRESSDLHQGFESLLSPSLSPDRIWPIVRYRHRYGEGRSIRPHVHNLVPERSSMSQQESSRWATFGPYGAEMRHLLEIEKSTLLSGCPLKRPGVNDLGMRSYGEVVCGKAMNAIASHWNHGVMQGKTDRGIHSSDGARNSACLLASERAA